MYETDIIENFSKVPVFTLGDVNQIVSNKVYVKRLVSKLVERGKIKKIRKGLYTFFDDPFLVSTFIVKPSYISTVSALSYYHKITQIPREVFCFTSKPTRTYFFRERINFSSTKNFWGFRLERYSGFEIPIATPEKALIDSVGKVPVSLIEEGFDGIDVERMVLYLKKTGNTSLIKRVGYLMEVHGYDVPMLKRYIDNKYISLDVFAKPKGAKNTKWKVVV